MLRKVSQIVQLIPEYPLRNDSLIASSLLHLPALCVSLSIYTRVHTHTYKYIEHFLKSWTIWSVADVMPPPRWILLKTRAFSTLPSLSCPTWRDFHFKITKSRYREVKWLACLWDTKSWAPVSQLQPRHHCKQGGVGRGSIQITTQERGSELQHWRTGMKGRHCGWMPLPGLGRIQIVIPSKFQK